MQDAMQATARRLGLVAAVVLVVFAATAARASADLVCGVTGPQVCVNVVSSPDTVPPPTPDAPTFVSYDVTITNKAPNTVTHLELTDVLPDKSTLVAPLTPSSPTCMSGSGVVQCAFGQLKSGATVKATILVQVPQVVGPVFISNNATVSFDERFNDSSTPDPQQDTVRAGASTLVALVPGAAASIVPSNAKVQLDTDPTLKDVASPQDENIGKALVPASEHPPISASLKEEPKETVPFTCPKKQICRGGAWLDANIADGATFSPALEFELHWSKLLVPKQQTVKNLAVFRTECLVGCPIETITARCSPSDPTPGKLVPCLSDVVETASEFRATLHTSHNGRMR